MARSRSKLGAEHSRLLLKSRSSLGKRAFLTFPRRLPLNKHSLTILCQGNDWPEPRLGQGAFQEAFRAVWRRTAGRELEATTGGKPTKLTYQHAEHLLLAQANHPDILPPGGHRVQELGPTFMVGVHDLGLAGLLVRSDKAIIRGPL